MNRIEHLLAIKKADNEYYNLDNPSLSDAEYDMLRREYIDQYGPEDLNYVPGEASSEFTSFRHPTPVTSLGKWTAGVDNVDTLVEQIKKLWPVVIEPKYDGLTVVAYPQEDGSCKFVTRGTGGVMGEVLPNFIPKYEGASVNNCGHPIRGEVFITPANFAELNMKLEEAGEEPMRNMRNAAAGLLRRKERSPHLNLLSYVVYDVPDMDLTPSEKMSMVMADTKFEYTQYFSDYDEAETVADRLDVLYHDLTETVGLPLDGMVVKSARPHSLEYFGRTEHHPKNAIAWKPESIKYTTVVRDVIWQMGRRKATPVAIVDPVIIDGATVTRASLHNAAMIGELGLKIGATVEIHKANEIIPQIIKVIEPGTVDIKLTVCPSCGGKLEEINGQQFCINPKCDERIAQDIAFLGTKDVLNIDGLSIATARKIVEAYKDKMKEHAPQNIIFDLNKDMILALDGFADKSAQKLYDNIHSAMDNVDMPHFIKALCVPGVGIDVGRRLAQHYKGVLQLLATVSQNKIEELIGIDGIGETTAKALCSDRAIGTLASLSAYIKPIAYDTEANNTADGVLAGKTVVLTGKMAHPRDYYVALIEKAGGKEGKSVTSKTDYLVIQDVNSSSSKAKKARELGTVFISPEDLEAMLAD